MPCRGVKENIEDFEDCLAQLYEILQKYGNTHYIILGDDFNDDLYDQKSTRRQRALNELLEENKLITRKTGKTYVSPSGLDTSNIDYIFLSSELESKIEVIQMLNDVQTNVSDHYPVMCSVNLKIKRTTKTNTSIQQSSRVKWDKVDKEAYSQAVTQKLIELKTDPSSLGELDCKIRKLNDILVSIYVYDRNSCSAKVRRHRMARLKNYSPAIKQAIREKKEAFWQWKRGNRPTASGDVLVANKKLTTSHLRKLCRIESAQV